MPAEGTGLASSSAFSVSLLHTLHKYRDERTTNKKLAEEACKIEIDILKEPIGKQDQYAVSYGGFNFISFNKDGSVSVDPVKINKKFKKSFEGSLLMFYVGNTRQASTILIEQSRNISSSQEKVNIVKQISSLALDFKKEIYNCNIVHLGKILDTGWQLKKQLAGGITNPDINYWYDKAVNAGAIGGKVLGAGGGGFILFIVQKPKQKSVRRALSKLREFDFKFEDEGSIVLYNNN